MTDEAIEILSEVEVDATPVTENKQLWENSPLSKSPIADTLRELTDGLYGAKDPNLAILREKPEHRLILLLKVKGFSNREIARQLGFTDAWISQVVRQPWFQVELLKELRKIKGEIVDSIVRVEATNSIFKLIQLRDNARSEEVQKSSAIHLLDMHLGKPIQRSQSVNINVQDTVVRVEGIDDELKLVEDEIKQLTDLRTHG
jgi:hypothetical protein